MGNKIHSTWFAALCGLLSILPTAQGATLQSLCTFPVGSTYPYGGLVQDRDGNLYGTTCYGGSHGDNYGGYGSVFKLTTNATLTTLASFANSNGANPRAGLVQGTDGNFYGTVANGGLHGINGAGSGGYGTIFRVATNGVLTALYSFPGGNDGANPQAELIQGGDGNFYGTAANGGSGGYGTVFRVTTNGTFATLAFFANTNGANPYAGLVQGSDGNFYGTTVNGGDNGYGTVFRVTTNGVLTMLASFNNTNGANPYGVLVQGDDGNLYGTTASGGTNGGYGTVFMVTTNGIITSLVSFAKTNGSNPYAGLVRCTDGNFYGTTVSGGINGDTNMAVLGPWLDGYGTVFMVNTNGILTTVYSFGSITDIKENALDGANPYGSLIVGNDGNFYGTTYNGGSCGMGTVFSITTNGTLTTLASFAMNPSGANPYPGVVIGDDNNFYGTTVNGGMNGGYGVVFIAATNGTLTTLASFAYTNGANPYGRLVRASDGSFYGTTRNGGIYSYLDVSAQLHNGYGTVFRITTNGDLTSIYSFTGGSDGKYPQAGLVRGPDDNFYGTTVNGGTNGDYGTVFMVTTNGTLATLLSFAGTNGANPYAGLTLGSDGRFYGTTSSGGSDPSAGTVFCVTTNGAFFTLVSFPSVFIGAPYYYWTYPYGANPQCDLLVGADGSFYGTTPAGGTSGYFSYGCVFKAGTNGTLTTIYHFGSSNVWNGTSLDGAQPYGGLVQGSDGSLYGTTSSGGPQFQPPTYSSSGIIFKMTTNGTLTTLYAFTGGSDGANPHAGLVEANDRNLYGTAYYGGVNGANYGTVFRIILAPAIFNQPTNQTVAAGGNVTFSVGASSFGPVNYQWKKNNLNIIGATNASLILTNVSVTNAANYSVAVSGLGGSTLSSNALLSVLCHTITISPATVPTLTVGQFISQTNNASGGIAPYAFSITSGRLPSGVTLSADGVLSGSPTRSGTYVFIIRAIDSYGCSGTNIYTLAVNCPTITLGTLPSADVGTPYNQTNSASGGASPYTFVITGGSLPTGFVLSSSGVLSGMATNAGNYSFTIKATDIHFCTGTNSYHLAIDCPAVTITPATLPTPMVGTPYSQTYSASGGTAPYTFAVTGGSLPPNFILSDSGVLSGTATNLGNYSFTVMVADTYGCTGNQNSTLEVPILLVRPSVNSNGWFHAQVVGPVWSTFVILASTNSALPPSSWSPLTTNTVPNGILDFTDTNNIGLTNNWPQRFYRAQLSQ
jgi:uncharacterized repeat protein (TIGR03803 family)